MQENNINECKSISLVNYYLNPNRIGKENHAIPFILSQQTYIFSLPNPTVMPSLPSPSLVKHNMIYSDGYTRAKLELFTKKIITN